MRRVKNTLNRDAIKTESDELLKRVITKSPITVTESKKEEKTPLHQSGNIYVHKNKGVVKKRLETANGWGHIYNPKTKSFQ